MVSLLDVRLVTASARRSAVSILAVPVVPGADAADADEPADDAPPPAFATTATPVPDAAAAYLPEAGHTGRAGEVRTLPRPGEQPATVHLLGIGDGDEAAWRKAGAALVRACSSVPAVSLALPSDAEPAAVRGLVEAALLATYRFTRASSPEPPKLKRLNVLVEDPTPYADAVAQAVAVATATRFARDMANTPSAQKDPAWFAAQARKAVEKHGVTVLVREPERLAREGWGGVLAVGSGSARGPRVVELAWAPKGATKHVVLIGKGITFDTGGISIKPAQGMQLMKKDMSGGAAVIGAVLGAALLKLPVKLTCVVPMAENMPSGTAYRPGDVVRHYGGRTSEILNTDAEGRVVLADALAYAASTLSPDVLVDLATLTGAQGVALGKRTAALYTDDSALAASLSAAAEAAGERVWRMPLTDDYMPKIDSPIADLNNAPDGGAGSVVAALYLREFTGAARGRWAHIDMSSPAWSEGPSDELTKGATGWGVRTLVRWLETVE
jgi:leucyl aminopeptidase